MKSLILFPLTDKVSYPTVFLPRTVTLTLRRWVFIDMSTPTRTPERTVPFLSSTVTDSDVRRWRNLNETNERGYMDGTGKGRDGRGHTTRRNDGKTEERTRDERRGDERRGVFLGCVEECGSGERERKRDDDDEEKVGQAGRDT